MDSYFITTTGYNHSPNVYFDDTRVFFLGVCLVIQLYYFNSVISTYKYLHVQLVNLIPEIFDILITKKYFFVDIDELFDKILIIINCIIK